MEQNNPGSLHTPEAKHPHSHLHEPQNIQKHLHFCEFLPAGQDKEVLLLLLLSLFSSTQKKQTHWKHAVVGIGTKSVSIKSAVSEKKLIDFYSVLTEMSMSAFVHEFIKGKV